jgi:hypothetical protein
MDRVNFNKNWNNKLFCDFFTTIRVRDDNRFQLGKSINAVLLSGDQEILSKPVKIYALHHLKLENLTDTVTLPDTGMNRDKTIGMFHTMYKGKFADINNVDFTIITLGKL